MGKITAPAHSQAARLTRDDLTVRQSAEVFVKLTYDNGAQALSAGKSLE